MDNLADYGIFPKPVEKHTAVHHAHTEDYGLDLVYDFPMICGPDEFLCSADNTTSIIHELNRLNRKVIKSEDNLRRLIECVKRDEGWYNYEDEIEGICG